MGHGCIYKNCRTQDYADVGEDEYEIILRSCRSCQFAVDFAKLRG
jgi:hypothetical protein